MSIKKVNAEEVKRLVAAQTIYLDVRSVPEFTAGHVPGAYSIPLLHAGPAGMQANPAFADQVQAAFTRDTPIIVGCKSGRRSAQAAGLLESLGFAQIYDFVGGWSGSGAEPGWVTAGGETSTEALPGRSYDELKG